MNRRVSASVCVLIASVAGAASGIQPASPPSSDPKPAAPPAKPEDKKPADTSKPEAGQPGDKKAEPAEDPAYVLGFTMKDINGKDVKLEQFKGKVVLLVNVASRCGNTPQYEGLQSLYLKKQDQGLVILGFPANNFGSQEPGTDAEIKEFCSSKYNVTFPMFSKISVMGKDQHALYKKLAAQPAPIGGDPKWNFTKFLVDRSGKVVARFSSNAKPDDAKDQEGSAMTARIDELLKSK